MSESGGLGILRGLEGGQAEDDLGRLWVVGGAVPIRHHGAIAHEHVGLSGHLTEENSLLLLR